MREKPARRSGGSAGLRPVALRAVVCAVSLLLVGSAVAGATLGTGSRAVADRQADGATELSSCTTITEPGRYVLTADIENATQTCIEITADDVVFDGAGHRIAASPSRFARHTGIRVTNAEDVTVTNVTLADWGFAGVYVRGASGGRIDNVTVADSRFGVTVRSSSDVTVVGVNATDNAAAGIDVSTTQDSLVAESTVADNRVGISLTTTSSRNRIVRNAIRDNEIGVVVSNADGNEVVNNTFCRNQQAVLRLERPTGNLFADNSYC